MSIKPKMSYKRRMERDDALWVIWSNKWSCWYRANSQGYTSDPVHAGLFSRDEAASHYEPERPQNHRTTEPFPMSVLKTEVQAQVAAAKAALMDAERRLETICGRATPSQENSRG